MTSSSTGTSTDSGGGRGCIATAAACARDRALPDRLGAAVTLDFADMAELRRRIERGELTPSNAAASAPAMPPISCDGDIREARLPPEVERGPPADLVFVPFVTQLQGEAHLHIRDHALVQEEMISGELAAFPGDPLDASQPDSPQPAHAASDRNASARDG